MKVNRLWVWVLKIKADASVMYKILLVMGFVLLGHAAYSAVQCKDIIVYPT